MVQEFRMGGGKSHRRVFIHFLNEKHVGSDRQAIRGKSRRAPREMGSFRKIYFDLAKGWVFSKGKMSPLTHSRNDFIKRTILV